MRTTMMYCAPNSVISMVACVMTFHFAETIFSILMSAGYAVTHAQATLLQFAQRYFCPAIACVTVGYKLLLNQ